MRPSACNAELMLWLPSARCLVTANTVRVEPGAWESNWVSQPDRHRTEGTKTVRPVSHLVACSTTKLVRVEVTRQSWRSPTGISPRHWHRREHASADVRGY